MNRPPARRRLLAAGLLLTSLTFAGLGSAQAAALGSPAFADSPPRVVVIAVPDLRWSDLSPQATPTMWRLLADGAAGALSVKSRWQLAGCADGVLTLGAGDRVAAEGVSDPARPCAGTSPDRLPAASTRADAGSGALVAALRAHGVHTTALGDGATLALPGPDATGTLDSGIPAGGAEVVVAVDDAVYAAPPAARAQAVHGADAQVAALVDPLPASTTVLLVGSSDRPPGEAHLHVALARGPAFPPGWLRSPSTKRAPYVELIDVAPTVLELVGAPVPSTMVGRSWEPGHGPTGATARAATLRDLDVKAVQGAHWRPPYMWSLGVLALLVALAALLVLERRRRDARSQLTRATEYAALTVASLPVASWLIQLVPWWRWNVLVLPVLLLGVSAAVAAGAQAAGRRRPVHSLVVVTAVSVAVLVADVVSGSRLQTSALLGDSPITAGRFYGAGNTAFGVLAVSTLLGVAVLFARRATPSGRQLARAAAAGGVLVVIGAVDAAPSLGADLGGALAYLPSALVLVLLLTGVRPTGPRVAVAAVAGVVPVVAVAIWDYHRPAARRTHIGDFVAELADGRAGSVLHRKLAANLGQLGSSPFLPLLIGTVVVVVVLLRRHGRALQELLRQTPGLGAGLVAAALCGVLGGVLNDSGVTVTGIMLSVALPAVLALAVRGVATDDDP